MTNEKRLQALEQQIGQLGQQISSMVVLAESLQRTVHSQTRTIRELKLWVSTGQPHKYCPECHHYPPIFSSIYMPHSTDGAPHGPNFCPNSHKPWSD